MDFLVFSPLHWNILPHNTSTSKLRFAHHDAGAKKAKHFLGRSDSVEGFCDLMHTRGVYQELVFGDVAEPIQYR